MNIFSLLLVLCLVRTEAPEKDCGCGYPMMPIGGLLPPNGCCPRPPPPPPCDPCCHDDKRTITTVTTQNILVTQTVLLTEIDTQLSIVTTVTSMSGCPRFTLSETTTTTSTTSTSVTTTSYLTTTTSTSTTATTSTFISTFYTYTKPCHRRGSCGCHHRRRRHRIALEP